MVQNPKCTSKIEKEGEKIRKEKGLL